PSISSTIQYQFPVVSTATGEPGSQRWRKCRRAPRSWGICSSRTSWPSRLFHRRECVALVRIERYIVHRARPPLSGLLSCPQDTRRRERHALSFHQYGPWLAPFSLAIERVISLWGTLCHHLESGVSRFIPSTLLLKSLEERPRQKQGEGDREDDGGLDE